MDFGQASFSLALNESTQGGIVQPNLQSAEEPQPPHIVRLPRFIVNEPIELGQIVRRITMAVGVQPCDSCDKRADGAGPTRAECFTGVG